MKIKKISGGKYKIYLDDKIITTTEEVIINTNLLYKDKVTEDLKNEILKETNFYEVYNKVVKFILKKRRSREEIKTYLDRFDIGSKEKNKVISKLEEVNLINDKEFCKCYINDKIYLNKYGLDKIKKELIKNNINLEIIEDELNNVDINVVNENLRRIISKKIKSNNKLSTTLFKQKIVSDLINLGYYRENILSILEEFNFDDSNALEKEYNKVYNKLSKKYDGNELITKIKLKLISKGFNSYNINNFIEKSEE